METSQFASKEAAMARNIVLTALLALSLGAGCGVKKETHGKVLDELATCQGELQASRSKVDEQGTRITQLESFDAWSTP